MRMMNHRKVCSPIMLALLLYLRSNFTCVRLHTNQDITNIQVHPDTTSNTILFNLNHYSTNDYYSFARALRNFFLGTCPSYRILSPRQI